MELYIQAIILGIIQGLGEFLPISSSGHLIAIPKLFGWESFGQTFDVALHFGTLVALIIYFFDDIKNTLVSKNWHLIKNLAIASIPAALIGFLWKDSIEDHLYNIPTIALALSLGGLAMIWADRNACEEKSIQDITSKDSLLLGLSQALALIPGVSRSGATMTAGLLLGLSREAAARYSFFMATIIVAGASALKIFDVGELPARLLGPTLAGTITAGIVGYLCISLFMKWISKIGLIPFAVYRIVLALNLILWFR